MNADITAYYDSTYNHYRRWWKLDKHLSIHYGIWDNGVKNFSQASQRSNEILFENLKLDSNSIVLDAGCGVGGTSIYMSQKCDAKFVGLTLIESQVEYARKKSEELNLQDRLDFEICDFTKTNFPEEHFDAIFASESVCHVPDKKDFLKESHRLLKPGGKLLIFDYFTLDDMSDDEKKLMSKWGKTWAIENFIKNDEFMAQLDKFGFTEVETVDYTTDILKSSKRMYVASMLGSIPSILYNLTHPEVRKYARDHYKSGIYQYRALKKGLWKYKLLVASK